MLHEFAALVSAGELAAAADLLTPSLKAVYASDNYVALRNTPRMEIVNVVDKTGVWPPDPARSNSGASVRVFYVEARYQVLGLTRSYFKDGEIYPHKVTVIKAAPPGHWLISELGTAPNRMTASTKGASLPASDARGQAVR